MPEVEMEGDMRSALLGVAVAVCVANPYAAERICTAMRRLAARVPAMAEFILGWLVEFEAATGEQR